MVRSGNKTGHYPDPRGKPPGASSYAERQRTPVHTCRKFELAQVGWRARPKTGTVRGQQEVLPAGITPDDPADRVPLRLRTTDLRNEERRRGRSVLVERRAGANRMPAPGRMASEANAHGKAMGYAH